MNLLRGSSGQEELTETFSAMKKLKFFFMLIASKKLLPLRPAPLEMLSIPVNYKVSEIASGCCGMAGSFGYEKEHFELSNKIGELVLFPEIRNKAESINYCRTRNKLQTSY